MTIRAKIIIGFAVITALGFTYLFHWVAQDLEPQYRKLTEEPLIDTARSLAGVASASVKDGTINVSMFEKGFAEIKQQTFKADVYDFTKSVVDLRVYITDRAGKVIFDSAGRALGEDYSTWLDVGHTLKGEYGARTSRDDPEIKSSVMYVAAPITVSGDIVGVLSVGKPTVNANAFVEQTRSRLLFGIIATLLTIFVVGSILARMLTAPIERLTVYARDVRDGKRTALPELGSGEVSELGKAFDEMRDALEGKKYIEQYMQTLTHEIKSPLSAIKGASELLLENPPEPQRTRFLENMKNESLRIQGIVERLLLLSRVEARREIGELEKVNLGELLEELNQSFLPIYTQKNIRLEISGDGPVIVNAERFLLRHAIANIIQNAIEFCSKGGMISIKTSSSDGKTTVIVEDDGAGIPDYALSRIFERFYSLQRPESGRKSSGLGLSLVREVMELHGGTVTVEKRASSGTRVILCL